MQQGHRLAGPRAARHLNRAGVADPVSDLALARVQEHAPRRERVREDQPQLLMAGHEGDLARTALHRRDEVVWIYPLGRRAGGVKPGHLLPGLVQGHAAGQGVQRGVLGLWQRRLPRLQVRLAGHQPDHRQDLRVDAKPGEIGVANVREQPLAIGLGSLLKQQLQPLDRFLVADFQYAERRIDAEPVAGGIGFRLVLRQNRDQAVGITGHRREYDAAPAVVYLQGADPVVPAALRLFQMGTGMGVLSELGDCRVNGTLHILVQPPVFGQKTLANRQACHPPCPPVTVPETGPSRAARQTARHHLRWLEKRFNSDESVQL